MYRRAENGQFKQVSYKDQNIVQVKEKKKIIKKLPAILGNVLNSWHHLVVTYFLQHRRRGSIDTEYVSNA